MLNKRDKKSIGITILVCLVTPFVIIFTLNLLIVFSSWLVSFCPFVSEFFIKMNLNDPINVSDYITLYVEILGIEVTALLTIGVFYLSSSKEEKEEHEEKEKNNNQVYMDIVDALDHLFNWYTNETGVFLKKFCLSEKWKDVLNDLKIENKYKKILKDIYFQLNEINSFIDEGRNQLAEQGTRKLFLQLSMDFYNTYKKQIGQGIRVRCILKQDYIDAINDISPRNCSFTKSDKYTNGSSLYTVINDIYTVYDASGQTLCASTFKDNKPYTGYARLYEGENLRFDGHIKEGKEIEGTLYNYRIDLKDNNKLFNNRLEYVYRFRDSEFCKNNNLNSGDLVRVATLSLKDEKITIKPETIKTGRKFIL